MTTAAEIFASDFLRSFEARPNQKFCVACNRRLNRTAFYRHNKSKIHLSTSNKKTLGEFFPLNKRTSRRQELQIRRCSISVLKTLKKIY